MFLYPVEARRHHVHQLVAGDGAQGETGFMSERSLETERVD
jgi:hypothetical protein